ncbi:RIO1 family domain-containing protein [Theileria equi strain WA]|uniref:Serine/threonine-protein kinase RIO2 n=1 Tax=Theileria equi strain WA TaxID=1537102 RepID=L0B1E1_THEEQ|nr:RIO1 family domain-containing protein [Theileria equi strain WA]AFZ81687.1 RIO1 family domain-containing protein [Theileria equi strain WA]|eukprot:XP_004831353.1 RIO1 family domain-containing protein [Theileria equi strain WA]
MKLDPSHFCYTTNTEFRVLTAIEMGMRNHEYMPMKLISATANLRSCGMNNVISSLLKSKLIVHSGKVYDGYKLTFLGLDYLALRALTKRGVVHSVGRRIGVGKEADVHVCTDSDGNLIALKFHRLGRISFRSVKTNRDYFGHRKHAGWMYLSQIAAKKEFSYLSSLYEESFPVPEPIDINRHVIAMRFVEGTPLSQVREMYEPKKVLNLLIHHIVKLAKLGIIHGDYNGFNLLINDDGDKVTVIDFPQVISVTHENAKFYFDRDIKCVIEMFRKKFKIDVVEYPSFDDVVSGDNGKLDTSKLKVDINKVDNEILDSIFENLRQEEPEYEILEEDELSTAMEKLTLLDQSDDSGKEIESADSDQDNGSSKGTESCSEYTETEDKVKEKPIQIWRPHVKRIGEKVYGKKLHSRARNKTNSGYKKDYKQRKIKSQIDSRVDIW